MHQLTQSALCSRFHGSVQRFARWLVLTAERAGTNRLPLTHEFVAQMVGAPQFAVTAAAAELRAKKIIDYGRGTVITLCCDSSPNRHASKHARAVSHPVVASAERGERWLYCFPDDAFAEY